MAFNVYLFSNAHARGTWIIWGFVKLLKKSRNKNTSSLSAYEFCTTRS